MDLDILFSAANTTALAGWIVLALSPLSPRWSDRISGSVLPLILSVLYTALALVHFAGAEGGFGTLDDVALLFASREIVLLGWVHYLAFDLFVGAWEARTARAEKIPFLLVLPCLALTFLLGPAGFLLFTVIRIARASVRPAPSGGPSMTAAVLAPAPLRMPNLRHEPLFAGAALVLALLTVPLGLALALDGRTIGGELIWVKPMKFAVALAIYLGTLAFFATWLPERMRRSLLYRLYAAVVVAAIAAEMVWIGGAASLGTTSHFNVATPVAGTIYGLMGVLAVTLTSASLVYGVAIWRNAGAPLPPAVRLSLGLGLIATFVLTLVVAGGMSSNGSHFVGTPESGAMLPIVGWSREVGDLRAGHFFATHAFHAVPLAGVILAALLPQRPARTGVVAAAILYAAFTLGVTAQAVMGRPFV